MEMPKPIEVHHKLAKFAGRWIGKEKLSPSPWDPKGGTAVGRCNNQLAAAGFIVAHEYVQERNGTASFHGHGVFSYDNAGMCYMLHWWDSMGFGINVFSGQFEGNTLKLLCKLPQGSTRGTWEFVDDRHYRFLMEVSPDGQKWMTMIEGDYTREG